MTLRPFPLLILLLSLFALDGCRRTITEIEYNDLQTHTRLKKRNSASTVFEYRADKTTVGRSRFLAVEDSKYVSLWLAPQNETFYSSFSLRKNNARADRLTVRLDGFDYDAIFLQGTWQSLEDYDYHRDHEKIEIELTADAQMDWTFRQVGDYDTSEYSHLTHEASEKVRAQVEFIFGKIISAEADRMMISGWRDEFTVKLPRIKLRL